MTDDLARRILAELADIKARLAAQPSANPSLTRHEAAAYLGVHPKTLAEMTTTKNEPGKVIGYRAGSRWKYRQADLDQYRDSLILPTKRGGSRESVTDWGQ